MSNTQRLKNMKFACLHSTDSVAIQTELFNLGYTWNSDKPNVISHKHKPFLYAGDNGQISFGESAKVFRKIGHEEFDLNDLKKMNNNFADMKIKVSSACHSELIQRELFNLGYNWGSGGGGHHIMYTEKQFLYATRNGIIAYGENDSYFHATPYPEFKLEQKYEFVEVTETVDSVKEAISKKLATLSLDNLKKVLNSL